MSSPALAPPLLLRSLEVVANDGVRLHVEMDEPAQAAHAAGADLCHDRPTVVFCHGYTMDMRAWAVQRHACAAAGYRVLAWDHRGHGASGHGEAGHYTIDQLGHDLAAVLSQVVGEQPVVLIGHSMGGMAIMALAESHPQVVTSQVKAVAFISSSAGGMATVTWGRGVRLGMWINARGPRLATAIAPYQDLVLAWWNAMPWLGNRTVAASFFGSFVPRSTAQLTEQMMVESDFCAMSDFVPTLRRHDKKSAVQGFAQMPSLVLVGDRDVLTPAQRSAALAADLPLAEHVLMTRAGHNITLEHPELMSDYILKLLERSVEEPQRAISHIRVRSTDVRPGRGRRALTLGSPA